jgi:hypothetical protein
MWFRCEAGKSHPNFEMTLNDRQRPCGCPYCSGNSIYIQPPIPGPQEQLLTDPPVALVSPNLNFLPRARTIVWSFPA